MPAPPNCTKEREKPNCQSSPAQSSPAMAFAPERCAEMHNALLRRATEHDPTAITERTLAARLLQAAPEFAAMDNLEEMPAYRLLSSLETTLAPAGRAPAPLTPLMLQPDPLGFWSESFAAHERPEVVLLYGQNDGSPADGGLFLDLRSCRVVWHWAPGPFPAEEEWVGLEVALQRSLDKWNSGKYFWNAENGIVDQRMWTESDVDDALSTWDRLLSSIEERLPQPEGTSERLEPIQIDQETRTALRISGFSAEFLTRASRPSFKYIAPGITTFSTESLTALYTSEDQRAPRRSYPTGPGDPDGDEWSTLLLPAERPVQSDTSRHPDPDVRSFDKNWGFGKFTVDRRAGLYVIAEVADGDSVRLITPSGQAAAGDFSGRCPWGERRPPRLAEILAHWASLVETGAWQVGADGVMEADDWFDGHLGQSKLSWHDQITP